MFRPQCIILESQELKFVHGFVHNRALLISLEHFVHLVCKLQLAGESCSVKG